MSLKLALDGAPVQGRDVVSLVLIELERATCEDNRTSTYLCDESAALQKLWKP